MSAAAKPILSASNLGVAVPGRQLVSDLNVSFERGEFVAVLGCNGAGKTMTLLTLAGLREAAQGVVALNGVDIDSLSRQVVAQGLALLPQDVSDVFPASVFDTALTGRHPHIARFSWESASDKAITRAALQQMQVDTLAERDILTLSGGERRRVAIAQLLAQSPEVYLLDEPSNHLDPQHQLEVLEVFRGKADAGAAVIASLHDVNLAARYADRCLLLYGDGRWDLGKSQDILTAERLTALYGTRMEALPWQATTLFVATGSGNEAA
jgi:iron complex transport system ATP-binding protein